MVSTVYVAALEPDTGKSVIALGMMEVLAGRTDRVGFFRPIVGDGPDPLVELMRERYGLAAGPQGVTYAEVQELTSAGRTEELVGRVVERFRALERDCDAVLCLGSDFSDVSSATEFALNLRLADNLGASVLAVVSGRRKSAADVVAAVRFASDALADAGSTVVGIVANRVDPADVTAVRAELGDSAYVVPYDPVLVEPTVGEVAAQTGARVLVGSAEELDRDVRAVVVAAATLPTVLDHLSEGALVLTPGDRSEIVLGMLAASVSPNAPHVSGLLLTTGLLPDPRVQRVLDGLAPHTPVLAVGTDTFTTAQAVGRVQGRLSGRKIPAALGLVERHVDTVELARRVEVTRSARVTPLMFEYDLVERARADRRHIVLPEGTDDRVLRATEVVLRRGVAAVTLLGPVDGVRGRAAALGLDIAAAAVVDPQSAPHLRERLAARYAAVRAHKGVTLEQARDVVADVSYFGTLMVAEGLADGMVSGAAHTTAHTIRPAFEVVKTVPGVRTVSSVFFMCLADRVLVYGDCAIIPEPTVEQLADIAVSSAATARRFGVEPRVAMLSYSTGTSGSGADVDRVRAATELVRSRAPELPVEGPIQYDAAVDASVAAAKLPGSAVAGQATVFVFPDLSSGNNTYKAVQRSAGAVAVGPVLQGLRRPVNDLSRGCTVADIINTVAITAIQAQSVQRSG
ncbi:MAG TPA: phosphate acetyltransferase [Mycobacteriales bacterium]